MTSSVYASLLALIIVWLSLRVINLRQTSKIVLGDGDDPKLQIAIRAQGNATEYIPISLILLVLLEMNKGHVALIHFGGLAILAGRIIHARGLITGNIKLRVLGMQITISSVIILAAANIFYFFYSLLRP